MNELNSELKIPKMALVALVGPSGSGKSTFAEKHFLPTEVISSDRCRGLVSDDENDQSATDDAFDVLNFIARKRLAAGRMTVIDATNVQATSRKSLIELAREYHVLPVAIVFNISEKVCVARNKLRTDRKFGAHVIRQQRSQLRQSLRRLKKEGFRSIFVLESPDEVDTVSIQRVPLWNDKSDQTGPFDIIGDVHSCGDELESLLGKLGYESSKEFRHPDGRRAIFVGDLVDRGPRSVAVLRIAMTMVENGSAFCVPGNHDAKLLNKLRGKDVKVRHGLAETLVDFDRLPVEEQKPFKQKVMDFIYNLVSHLVFDNGKLVVAHAGLPEEMHGRGSGKVREFALYGETTGETDEFGLPVRLYWAADYRGDAMVVYGHTPVPEPQWLNKTINVDTGCVFGGSLTALRYPEHELVQVPAKQVWCEPVKPLATSGLASAQHANDDLLDAQDVIGKRIVSTRLRNNITIHEENATAALEIMSRFAANPKWLIYLPPTMSPCEASGLPEFLEHPAEAFNYFRRNRVEKIVCEEKHMGSRAVVVICRDAETAQRRFGISNNNTDHPEAGIIYTRTGRRFFNVASIERDLLAHLRKAMTGAGFWEQLETDWACFDCELMPWSVKAHQMIQTQYAGVAAAGLRSGPQAIAQLQAATTRLESNEAEKCQAVLDRIGNSQQNLERFRTAYRGYCWEVNSLEDIKLAPFHLLATENQVHTNRDHVWHMDTIRSICEKGAPILHATEFKTIELADDAAVQEAIEWWLTKTAAGGEGMVVKSLDYLTRGKKGLNQPAVKCRGPEYLRIIYGPDYDRDDNLKRLKQRQVGRKRSLAIRELALGIESLERFVKKEPLRRVHECVFGVLALESEPVDPRL